MNPLFQWLANLFRRGKPGPEGTDAFGQPTMDDGSAAPDSQAPPGKQLIGMPSVAKAAATPSVAPARSPELDELWKDYNAEKATLAKPAAVATPTAAESLIAGLSGVLTRNVQAKQATFGAPMALAQVRAEQQNAALEADQKNAAMAMGHTGALINAYLDRDAQTDRINQLLQSQLLKGQQQEALQQLKNNPVMVRAIATLIGTGGATIPGLKTLFLQQHPDWTDDVAENAAEEAMRQVQTDPSLQIQIKQAGLDIQKEKANTGRIGEIDRRIKSSTDAGDIYHGLVERYRMTYNADPSPEEDSQMLAHAQQLAKLNTDSLQSRIDLNVKTAKERVQQGNLAAARAATEEIRQKHLGNLMDAQAHHAEAAANEAQKRANDYVAGLSASGKPVTGTAYFNAHEKASTAADKADGQLTYWTKMASRLRSQASDPRHVFLDGKGEKIDPNSDADAYQAAKDDLETKAQAAEAMRDRWQLESAHARERMGALDAAFKQSQSQQAAAGSGGSGRSGGSGGGGTRWKLVNGRWVQE